MAGKESVETSSSSRKRERVESGDVEKIMKDWEEVISFLEKWRSQDVVHWVRYIFSCLFVR